MGEVVREFASKLCRREACLSRCPVATVRFPDALLRQYAKARIEAALALGTGGLRRPGGPIMNVDRSEAVV
jgi:hypothetical protein